MTEEQKVRYLRWQFRWVGLPLAMVMAIASFTTVVESLTMLGR